MLPMMKKIPSFLTFNFFKKIILFVFGIRGGGSELEGGKVDNLSR
jgi:hypothetical protein